MRSTGGNVVFADILTNSEGKSTGSGLVEFETADQAQQAIAQLTNSTLHGRQIWLREVRGNGCAPRAGMRMRACVLTHTCVRAGSLFIMCGHFAPLFPVAGAGRRVRVSSGSGADWDGRKANGARTPLFFVIFLLFLFFSFFLFLLLIHFVCGRPPCTRMHAWHAQDREDKGFFVRHPVSGGHHGPRSAPGGTQVRQARTLSLLFSSVCPYVCTLVPTINLDAIRMDTHTCAHANACTRIHMHAYACTHACRSTWGTSPTRCSGPSSRYARELLDGFAFFFFSITVPFASMQA